MPDNARDMQAAHELGKIYNSLMDRKMLCDFFLESALGLARASRGFLYLSSSDNNKTWLESQTDLKSAPSKEVQARAESVLKDGKPFVDAKTIAVPLVVRNNAVGVAVFEGKDAFTPEDMTAAANLAAQAASALKNILLFEENLKMERLASIGRTLSMVMHEIKNIIQVAKFSQEYLRMGINENKPQFLQKGSDLVAKAIREMDGFTYEMLSLTKDYEIKPEPMDMPALLSELSADLKDKAASFSVKLDFSAEDGLEARGEPRSLYRALLNLVKNALEACDKKESFIKIRARAKDADTYEIVVEDNGQGMSDEVKAKIFQAFFSTKGEKGTGLGLLVIDRTVKAHHGKLAVESEPGKGTKFILTLPKTPGGAAKT